MSKKIIILLVLLVVCVCILVSVGVFFAMNSNLISFSSTSTPTPTTSSTVQSTQDDTTNPTSKIGYTPINLNTSSTPVDLKVTDIYNDKLSFTQNTTRTIAELDWFNYVITTAKKNGWNGSDSASLNVNPNSIPQSFIDKLKNDYDTFNSRRNIPQDLQKYYIGSSVESDISQIIYAARGEFVAYIKAKGINASYLDEINNNALPDNKSLLKYYGVAEQGDNSTQTEAVIGADGSKADYSKLQISFYAQDFFNHTRKIVDSGILGPVPASNSAEFDAYYLKARSIGIRYLVYHEMGHVLQKAVDSVNYPAGKVTSKANWLLAPKSLVKLDNKYEIQWSTSDVFSNVDNAVVSQESQAEGISFEILTSVHNMSEVQKRLTWEYLFGSLNKFRDEMDQATAIITAGKPQVDLKSVDTKIYSDVIKQLDPSSANAQVLYKINNKLMNLPAYQGYLHPREPQDMPVLWDYLK